MDAAQKVRENRVRNRAARQGLRLRRSRLSGTYELIDAESGRRVMKDAGEDWTAEWDAAMRRPSARAMRQEAERTRLSLGDAEQLLKGSRTLTPVRQANGHPTPQP